MNIFRITADVMHVVSILILFLKILTSKSCAGISLRTQELYLIVFVTRYLDLFLHYPFRSFLTFYNTVMKILYLSSSAYIIYLMRKKFQHTYTKQYDTFRTLFLIVPSALLALLFHLKLTFVEILWAFSIFLESVAILPQLFLLQKCGQVENITSHYIFCLGSYRALYIVNWIYRYFTEPNYRHYIDWICGVIQTLLYADFFYYYFINKTKGKKLKLPA